MKVLVTGGSGRLGQFAIADLLEHGHEVINADRRRAPENGPNARFVETDLSDVGQVAGLLSDCDAVVHLGAIPSPWGHADEVVFTNNTINTYAVFQAAWITGVQNVVFASSASAYGMAWSVASRPPSFVPVDESHPFLVAEPYGLSKEVDERTAEMFHRRSGMQAIGLRFHWWPIQPSWMRSRNRAAPIRPSIRTTSGRMSMGAMPPRPFAGLSKWTALDSRRSTSPLPIPFAPNRPRR